MADMTILFAERGVSVTLVTTPLNALRIKPTIDRATVSGLPVRLVQLDLPLHDVGLPQGCESFELVPSRSLFWNFFAALSKLQKPVEQLLQELDTSPSCIISDKNLIWTADIATKFGIPSILFDGTSCFSLLCNHNIVASNIHESVSESEPFLVPGLGDRIEFTTAQLPGDLNSRSKDYKDFHKKVREAAEGAYGVVVNSFEEIESDYVEEYRKAKGVKVWCIGPVSLSNKTELEKAGRGNLNPVGETHECMKWLDSLPKNSAVYVCLGSLCRLTVVQLIELGLGLEASNRPFIWLIKGNKSQEIEKWILEDGFEEKMKGRGFLIHGWAPQLLIFSHPAVGGFLTHCGWNSTLERVSAGIPMITWPMFADQFYNEKLIVQVLKIGERVGVDVGIPIGDEEKFGVLVTRRQVKKAIDKVMADGKQGEERRGRAKMLAEIAKKAIEEGGSSYLNICLLIEDMKQLAYV